MVLEFLTLSLCDLCGLTSHKLPADVDLPPVAATFCHDVDGDQQEGQRGANCGLRNFLVPIWVNLQSGI